MSTSPLGNAAALPESPRVELHELVVRYHSAMFCADDCLRRAKDNCNFEDVAHCNFDYADRQLMLAGQYVEKARIALELAKRAVVARAVAEATEQPHGTFGFDMGRGPYGGDRL